MSSASTTVLLVTPAFCQYALLEDFIYLVSSAISSELTALITFLHPQDTILTGECGMKKKISLKEFSHFKSIFQRYQNLFGLKGYCVYFKTKGTDEFLADISTNTVDMIATVRLSSYTEPEYIESTAKHEAIHLLLARLVHYAHERFVSKEDIDSATEEIVRKLEGLVPNLIANKEESPS